MPKRGIVASLLTAAGLVLLLSFKTPTQTSPTADGLDVGQRSTPEPARSNTAPSSRADSPTALPTATPTPQTASDTVTGPVIPTRFGNIQLKVTFSDGKIADVTALQLPNDRPRSAYISSVVAPFLRQEALQAQSAQIDLLSGATYTSEAYAESLQAVLDQNHG